jgi:hypothetical protein
LEFGKKSVPKKCNHSIDTVATKQDTGMRDFFVNYEHSQISAFFVGNMLPQAAKGRTRVAQPSSPSVGEAPPQSGGGRRRGNVIS